MQRGDRVVGIAIISVCIIIGIVALVVLTAGPTGQVYATSEFIPEATWGVCGRLVCQSALPPYFLGMKGNFAACCCPEHYKGGRTGWCTNPIYITP